MSKIPKDMPSGYSQIVMFCLICHGDKSIPDIAEMMGIEYTSANVTIHRLIKKGLVERNYPIPFSRYHEYALTTTGIEVRDFLGIATRLAKE